MKNRDIEKETVLKCLELIVEHSSYEQGAVSAFNAITDHFKLKISYEDIEQTLEENHEK